MKQSPCHKNFEEAIMLLAADCLPVADRVKIEQHLAGCAACRETYENLRSLCKSLTAEAADSPDSPVLHLSPGFHARLVDVIVKPVAPTLWQWLAPFAAATCAIIGFLFWQMAGGFAQPRHASLATTHHTPEPFARLEQGTTLSAYERAANLSEEEFDAFLTRQAANILPPDDKSVLASDITAFGACLSNSKTFPESL